MIADCKKPSPDSEETNQGSSCQVIPIDVLLDDVLLAIFDFCVNQDSYLYQVDEPLDEPIKKELEAWQSLVHVCRRWRSIIFGSPHRLNLRLVCTSKTPARDTLDVWPALPLLIRDRAYVTENFDNVISVLERSDRVGQIYLYIPAWELEEVSAAMQEPFPELTSLELTSYETVTILPDSFLGGSAPRLRFLLLNHIPFPGLPKLLSSATHLVRLTLWNIPRSGYFSPEAMVTALSVLTSLDELFLEFASPRSRPDQASRRRPPPIRSALPVLTSLNFKGVSEYLEDFVAHVDAPQLNNIYIFFFNDIVFDTPQFIQFVSRTPTLKALEKARFAFRHTNAEVNLSSQTSEYGKPELRVQISCRELDWQLSSLEQVCGTSRLPPFSTLEDLYIYEDRFWQDDIENALWLELLHPFTAVKNLYLCKKSAPRILPAMQELVGGRTTEVLPNLKNIFLEELESSGPVQEGIGLFVAARQVTDHPIAVSRWNNSVRDKF